MKTRQDEDQAKTRLTDRAINKVQYEDKIRSEEELDCCVRKAIREGR